MVELVLKAIRFCRGLPSSDSRCFLDDDSIKRFESLLDCSLGVEAQVKKCLKSAKDQFPKLREVKGCWKDPGDRMEYLRYNYPTVYELN